MILNYKNRKIELLYICITGSRLYGTQYEKGENPFDKDYVSDYDWKGVYIDALEDRVGLDKFDEQIIVQQEKNEDKDFRKSLENIIEKSGYKLEKDDDVDLYELEKFFKLSIENNPNIMDMLFAPEDKIVFISEKGKKLRENRNLFLSKNIKNTFLGYSESQLKRIKGHNKWINKFPLINEVIEMLQSAYKDNKIDFMWLSDHFNGDVAIYITEMTQQEFNKTKNKIVPISLEEWIEVYTPEGLSKSEIMEYTIPHVINYCHPKDLKARPLSLESKMSDETFLESNMTIKEFLFKEATFRSISNSLYNIFTKPNDKFVGGLFTREGNVRKNDPEKVGEFLFQMSIDPLNFKKDRDNINALWKWRTNRNQKRSVLEEHFGYDVKHGMHLFRLLLKCKNILLESDYNPVLTKEELKESLDIRNGLVSYEELIEKVDKIKYNVNEVKSNLPDKPNRVELNTLFVSLLLEKEKYE